MVRAMSNPYSGIGSFVQAQLSTDDMIELAKYQAEENRLEAPHIRNMYISLQLTNMLKKLLGKDVKLIFYTKYP